MSTSEVGLHSKLISELLNPKGSHNQDSLFLKIFLDECNLIDFFKDIDLDKDIFFNKTIVIIEEHVGVITKNYETGGRIDIVLKFDNGKIILIENKIYAPDQKNQLIRYKNAYPNAKIVYLNLWGDDISINKIAGLNKTEFIWISYKENIINWLTNSLKEVYNKPNLIYIIEHYIKTIKNLTNQNTNNYMNTEISDLIIKSKNNISTAFTISKALENIKSETAKVLISQVRKDVYQNLLKEKFDITLLDGKDEGYSGNWVGYKLTINNTQYNLFLYFNGYCNDIFIGLKANDLTNQTNHEFNEGLKSKIKLLSHPKTREWLYTWMQKEEFEYYQLNEKTIYEINSGESIKKLTDLFREVISSVTTVTK